ncbi:solute carrier family 2, facilitated glucose transporter member 12 isoform X2 [Engraulis encrasicolus]|uniref:solute carrier family 2, facilitated glucose transporter member 12 isoform X2 n=1 Tax=Engraulis encrasicolus TaxID=184585 RepID=UPI002FD1E19B
MYTQCVCVCVTIIPPLLVSCAGCGAVLVLSALVASVSGLLLGYEMGLISGALLQLRGDLALSCRGQEMVVSSLLLGALFFSVAGGAVLDRWGRRFAIVLTAGMAVGGTLLMVCLSSLASLVAGRVVVGMAVALSGTASCLYIAEVAPQAWRGRLVCLYELMVVLGVLLGFGLSYAFSAVPGGWRYTFAAVIPPALAQALAMYFLPRSPRFLLAQGKEEEARAVLERLRGSGTPSASSGETRSSSSTSGATAAAEAAEGDLPPLPPSSPAVEEELRSIRAALCREQRHSFLDLFRGHDNMRQRLLVGAGLVVLTQVTGQPNLLSYASTVLHHVGFQSDQAATLASTGLGLVKVAGTLPAILLVDRVGPKAFLTVGAVVMTLSLATLGVATMQSHTQVSSLCQSSAPPPSGHNHSHWGRDKDMAAAAAAMPAGLYHSTPSTLPMTMNLSYPGYSPALGQRGSVAQEEGESVSSSLKWISLVSLLVYVTAFSFSLGPMVYVVLSEIFPTGIRGKAVSVVSAFNWGSNLIISMTFLTLTEKIGLANVIFSYAVMSFILLIFIILFIPETKGRSLEQISKELAMKNNLRDRLCPWRTPKTDTSLETKTLNSV